MDYRVTGKVIHGDGYGRKIGFPTVNLEIKERELPKDGVYAGVGFLGEEEYKAGIIIGPKEKIEAHLVGYDGDAYGKEVTLEIKKFLREYRKFETEEELINQIKKDLKLC